MSKKSFKKQRNKKYKSSSTMEAGKKVGTSENKINF